LHPIVPKLEQRVLATPLNCTRFRQPIDENT
jgi:hypothetical protein